MKLHPMETMPMYTPVLVKMNILGGFMKEIERRDTYYYVCIKEPWGPYRETTHIVEANGEGYAEFNDDDNAELVGWASLDELDELFE